jgi:hypothetical protein
MEQVVTVGADSIEKFQSKLNQELRTLDGKLIDIKYQTVYISTEIGGWTYHSAIIIYERG